ncbi:MAG: alpha-glucosidase C-terminal domain-containing protein [Candidatus Cloacimonetes bacterium]|nr:alpha-glucosidase C-terminal domain-containing protein [Candidatus Cloacimonadota bacterium]
MRTKAILFVMLFCFSLLFAIEYSVTLDWTPEVESDYRVFVAGEFNGWSTSRHPLMEKEGVYTITLSLKPGRYLYSFVVEDVLQKNSDKQWIPDDSAIEFEPNSYGGKYSVLKVGDEGAVAVPFRKVGFKYIAKSGVEKVAVSGSFNNWSYTANPMRKISENTFETCALILPGDYQYKFAIDNARVIADPNQPYIADSFGNHNSLLTVTENMPEAVTIRGDGIIQTCSLPANQSVMMLNPLPSGAVVFRCKAYSNDIESAYLILDGRKLPMYPLGENGMFTWYQRVVDKANESASYYYLLQDGAAKLHIKNGLLTKSVSEGTDFVLNKGNSKPLNIPDWATRNVGYKVVIDRFYNGSPANDPDFTEKYYAGMNTKPIPGEKLKPGQRYYHLVRDWENTSNLNSNPYDSEGKADRFAFYGGDFEGLHQKMDYFKSLGIGTLFISPAYTSRSYLKFDAIDMLTVDPHLGTEKEFADFIAAAHKIGIKVVMELTFNHVSDEFSGFQKAITGGKNSIYYNWFEWKQPLSTPLKNPEANARSFYHSWNGTAEFPELNFDLSRMGNDENHIQSVIDATPNRELTVYLVKVTDYWLSLGLDGFSFELADNVPVWFWKELRTHIKSIKPDIWMIGSVWQHQEPYLDGCFDTITKSSYFSAPTRNFFATGIINEKQYANALSSMLIELPLQNAASMPLYLSNRTTNRFLPAVGNKTNTLENAIACAMNWLGVPVIFYGDEIGLQGAIGPDSKRPFNWKYFRNKNSTAIRRAYQKHIARRSDNPVLANGSCRVLYSAESVLVFERQAGNKHLITVINNSDESRSIPIPCWNQQSGKIKSLVSGNSFPIKAGVCTIKLSGKSNTILERISP